jgi:hypothetical protein
LRIWTQQRRIEDIRAVGGGDDDDIRPGLETVHLDEDLVERLLALVMTAAESGTAMTSNSVDLVHEHDGRSFGLRPLEQIAHAACAHADEHLDEFRPGNAEERHARLTRHRAGHQRLAGAGRPDHQHAFRDARAEADELLRLFQELDHFGQFLLGFLRARHIDEGHLRTLHIAHHARPAASEIHRLILTAAHRAAETPDQPDDQDGRQQGDRQLQHERAGGIAGAFGEIDGGELIARDSVGLQGAEQVGLALFVIGGGCAVVERDDDIVAPAHDDLGDVAVLDALGKAIERDGGSSRYVIRLGENEQKHQHDDDADHQPEALCVSAGQGGTITAAVVIWFRRFVAAHAAILRRTMTRFTKVRLPDWGENERLRDSDHVMSHYTRIMGQSITE